MLRVRLKILKITSKKCPQDSNKYLKTLQTDSSLTFKFSYDLALSIYDFISMKGVAVVFSINVKVKNQHDPHVATTGISLFEMNYLELSERFLSIL